MGSINSKDTRRISFNNNFAIMPALVVQKSIEDETLLDVDTCVATETDNQLLFTDSHQAVDFQEDGELQYWAHRIENLKQEHRLINKIIETEYEKTIEKTSKSLEITPLSPGRIQKMKPCYDWRAKILECYEDNPHQPLICSPVVQAFTRCVTSCSLEE